MFSAGAEDVGFVAHGAVNLLAETVVLNYMALHGQEGAFQNLKWANGLGTSLGNTAGLVGLPGDHQGHRLAGLDHSRRLAGAVKRPARRVARPVPGIEYRIFTGKRA